MKNKIVELKGITNKGKDHVAKHGSLWLVTKTTNSAGFSAMPGPWLSLKAVDSDDARTVHASSDENFQVIDHGFSIDDKERLYYQNVLITKPMNEYHWGDLILDTLGFITEYPQYQPTIIKSDDDGYIVDLIGNNDIQETAAFWWNDYIKIEDDENYILIYE